MKKMTLAMMALALMCASPAFAHDAKKMEMKADHYMNKMDTNNDGMVSKSEHDAFGAKMFSEADTNKDGMLSKDEMIAKKKKEKMDMKDMMHDRDHD